MKILITNDDGIHASGLTPLVKWAQKLGQVTVIAPKVEQSGKSHGIELHKAFELKKVDLVPGVTAYSLDSTPADCIRYAILGRKEHFDLVISGINRGLNIGSDIMYSGTVGAIFEAEALGVPGIALSTSPAHYGHAHEQLDEVLDFVLRHKLMEKCSIYNINIPENHRGIRITRQGGPYYSDDFIHQEGDMVMPHGKDVFQRSDTMERDTDAVLAGHYISIMPLTNNRADMDVYRELSKLNP